jgi:hypothetical protein
MSSTGLPVARGTECHVAPAAQLGMQRRFPLVALFTKPWIVFSRMPEHEHAAPEAAAPGEKAAALHSLMVHRRRDHAPTHRSRRPCLARLHAPKPVQRVWLQKPAAHRSATLGRARQRRTRTPRTSKHQLLSRYQPLCRRTPLHERGAMAASEPFTASGRRWGPRSRPGLRQERDGGQALRRRASKPGTSDFLAVWRTRPRAAAAGSGASPFWEVKYRIQMVVNTPAMTQPSTWMQRTATMREAASRCQAEGGPHRTIQQPGHDSTANASLGASALTGSFTPKGLPVPSPFMRSSTCEGEAAGRASGRAGPGAQQRTRHSSQGLRCTTPTHQRERGAARQGHGQRAEHRQLLRHWRGRARRACRLAHHCGDAEPHTTRIQPTTPDPGQAGWVSAAAEQQRARPEPVIIPAHRAGERGRPSGQLRAQGSMTRVVSGCGAGRGRATPMPASALGLTRLAGLHARHGEGHCDWWFVSWAALGSPVAASGMSLARAGFSVLWIPVPIHSPGSFRAAPPSPPPPLHAARQTGSVA